MEFVCGSGGLPVGYYQAMFAGAEPFDQNIEKFGPGISLKFKVIGGEHNGEEGSRICSAKLSPKSSLGKFAVALKGGPVATGERFNFAHYVGTTGTIIVEATDSGGTRIATFLRAAPPQSPHQAQAPAAPPVPPQAPPQPEPPTEQEF